MLQKSWANSTRTARNNLGTAKEGKTVPGLFTSKLGYPVTDPLWLTTRKLQTKRNPGLYLQEMLTIP